MDMKPILSTASEQPRGWFKWMADSLASLPWRGLWNVSKPFWFSEQKWAAWALLLGSIALMVANVGIGVAIVKLSGRIAGAFQPFSYDELLKWVAIGIGLAFALGCVQSWYARLKTTLCLKWRRWLSASLINAWYDEKTRPYIKVVQKLQDKIPNPDYVMTQDPDSLSNVWIGLAFSLGETAVNLLSYGIILLMLSYLLSVTAVLWAAANTIAVILIGKSLFKLNDQAFNADAAVKVYAGRARTEGDAIAFGQGEKVARVQTVKRLNTVIDFWLDIMRVNFRMQLFSTTWNLIMPMVPPLIMAFVYRGKVDYAYVVTATGAFTAFYNAANVLPNQFGAIANLAAIVNRLSSLMEAIAWCGQEPDRSKHIEISIGTKISFDKVTILTPDSSRVLWSELTFALSKGDKVLAVAPHVEAQGLTSLFKTVAGISNRGCGRLERPPADKIMFLTSNIDLPPQTLRETLSYPDITPNPNDAELVQKLVSAQLPKLAERMGGLDVLFDWKKLSTTEQQRLGLARILLHKPEYVCVDAAALDEDVARTIYMALDLIGAAVMSLGTATPLLQSFHQQTLELLPNGAYKTYPIAAAK